MSRALTLVEMVASLALLALIAASLAAWASTAARLASADAPSEWRLAAATTLQHIQDDLLAIDGSSDCAADRLTLAIDRVEIRTRRAFDESFDRAQLRHEYTFKSDAGLLLLTERDTDHQPSERIVLDRVTSFIVQTTEEDSIFRVEITSSLGDAIARSFAVP